MAEHKGVKVTCEDLETGETDSVTIWDDVLVVTAGSAYIAGVQDYPGKGTQGSSARTALGCGEQT